MIKIACPIAPRTGVSFFRMYQPLIALEHFYPEEFKVTFFHLLKFGELFEQEKFDIFFTCAPPPIYDIAIDLCKKYLIDPEDYMLPL